MKQIGSKTNVDRSGKTSAGGNADQALYWEVEAVRTDLAPLVVERPATDAK